MKIPILILKFMFLAALFIVSNNNLYLSEASDRAVFYDMYSGWFGKLFDQAIDLTGYVAKSEWLPNTNSSLSLRG